MTSRPRAAIVVSVLLLPVIATAELTEAQRAEQAELLAWVRTLQLQGRSDEATALCAMILATDPQNVEALTQRGITHLAEGQFGPAHEDFNQALRVAPGTTLALVGRAHSARALGETEVAQRDALRAAELCTQALESDPQDAWSYYVRGLARLLLQQEDEALQDFVSATEADAGLVEARAELAQLYRRSGRYADAINQLTEAVRMRPDYAVGYLERARARFEARDFLAARDDCDRALQVNPQFARSWHNRGLINLQLGEVLAAVQDLTRAISARPGYASAHYYRGEAYYHAGNRAAARADWEKAAELAPEEWAGQAAAEKLRKIESGEL